MKLEHDVIEAAKEVMAWLTVSSAVIVLRVTYYFITGV